MSKQLHVLAKNGSTISQYFRNTGVTLYLATAAVLTMMLGCSSELQQEIVCQKTRKASVTTAPRKIVENFTVRNPTDREMTLTLTTKSCSCAEVQLSQETVAPYEETEIGLEFDLLPETQVQSLTAVFSTGLEMPSLVVLRLNVKEFAPLSFAPISSDEFVLAPGAQKRIPFELTYACPIDDAERPQIELDGADDASLEIVSRTTSRSDDVRLESIEGNVLISCPTDVFESPRLPGRIEEVTVVASLDSGYTASLPIRWLPVPIISAQPSFLFIGADQPTRRTGTIALTSKLPFKVSEIKAPDGLELFTRKTTKSTEHVIEWAVEKMIRTHGWDGESIEISTDHPEHQVVAIPLFSLSTN